MAISILRNWLTTFEGADLIYGLGEVITYSLKEGIDALVDLQSDGPTAIRYQVHQIRDILIKYKIDKPKEAADE